MSKIRIVNWLLTRRCNLKCEYCAIVRNYDDLPAEYPNMNHYHKNEMETAEVIEGLLRFKKHNPDAFHIFYGGEPLLRKDLYRIINYCNKEDIHYTVISNNTPEIQPLIKELVKKVDTIKGFTASIDPILVRDIKMPSARQYKTKEGFEFLKWMKQYCNDVVAEITATKLDLDLLYDLVMKLTANGMSSDITFIDIAKSNYYDFSNVYDKEALVYPSAELADQFQKINDSDADIHMKNVLLPAIWDILPSNMDCKIDENLHNVSVDADGSIRLCLRIRGVHAPKLVNLRNLFRLDTFDVSPIAHSAIKKDKREYCKLCNHTCHLMSRYIDANDTSPDDLVHLDRRK